MEPQISDDMLKQMLDEFAEVKPDMEHAYLGQGVMITIPTGLTKRRRKELLRTAFKNIFRFGWEFYWHGWHRVFSLGVQTDLLSWTLLVSAFGASFEIGYRPKERS